MAYFISHHFECCIELHYQPVLKKHFIPFPAQPCNSQKKEAKASSRQPLRVIPHNINPVLSRANNHTGQAHLFQGQLTNMT